MMYDSAGLGGPPILKFSEFASSSDINDKIHEMATEHTPTEAPTAAYRPNLDYTFCITAATPIVKIFNTITKALFVTSWTTYLEQKIANENLLRVKHFISLTRAATATTTTAMDVDNIDITNTLSVESHIDKCVRLETKKQTKNLEKEIQTLKCAIAKNNSRGAKLPGASDKKKTDQKRRTSGTKPQPKTAAKVAGADAATSKPKPNSGRKSQKKGKTSRNKKRN